MVTQTSGEDGNGYQTSMLLKKLNPNDKSFTLPGTGMEVKFVSTTTVGGVQSAGVRVSKVGGTCKGMMDSVSWHTFFICLHTGTRKQLADTDFLLICSFSHPAQPHWTTV